MQSKNLVLRQFTEKPSKELKSSYLKGDQLEKKASLDLEKLNGVPVLVSSLLLREIRAGQVDLCLFRNGSITIFEIKSRPCLVGPQQRNRLNRSLNFLCEVFFAEGCIKILKYLPKD